MDMMRLCIEFSGVRCLWPLAQTCGDVAMRKHLRLHEESLSLAAVIPPAVFTLSLFEVVRVPARLIA